MEDTKAVDSSSPKKEEDDKQEDTTNEALPLDWTQMGEGHEAPPLRYPSDVADIDPTDTELCLVGTAGLKVTQMGKDLSSLLHPETTKLILRSHMIVKMEGLEGLTHLELLELYDNSIEVLENLADGPQGAPGSTLKVLDMSYNVIRDMQPVQLCSRLVELYLANNKLKSIAGLEGLVNLKKIDLGANRIRVMDPAQLENLVNLEELWLGKNKIEQIQGLDKLVKLRRLDVQSNRLTKVDNLTAVASTLEELYLAHNGIDDEGALQPTGFELDTFEVLNVLDLSRNKLTTTTAFVKLTALEELWLSGNQIASFDAVEPLTDTLTNLDTIYLEYNPLADDFEYRKRIAQILPSLTQIDANMIQALPTVPAAAAGSAPRGIVRIPTPRTEEEMKNLQDKILERAKSETKK